MLKFTDPNRRQTHMWQTVKRQKDKNYASGMGKILAFLPTLRETKY
jgi:hypothetical protein